LSNNNIEKRYSTYRFAGKWQKSAIRLTAAHPHATSLTRKKSPRDTEKIRFVADALTDSVAAEIRADGLTCQDRRQGGHSAWTGRADAAN
jgi:hypothetical protein